MSIVTDNELRQILEEVISNLEEELSHEVINIDKIREAKRDLIRYESLSYMK